jgi:OOP family OmpA-OmpF porin
MKYLILPIFIFFTIYSLAQKSCIYQFQHVLTETSGQGPELIPLGTKGTFVEESLPELGGIKRVVYKFDKNCGLNYDVTKSMVKLNGSYSIEMYFKFDALDSWKRVIDFKNRSTDNGAYIFNGKLNFYNIITSEIAPVAPGQYTHYTFTYDANSKMVNIYADGIGKISFPDSKNDAIIDSKELHFFYDDLQVNNEASSGTVAYIKLFDYAVPPDEAKKNYEVMEKTLTIEQRQAQVLQSKANLQVSILNASNNVPLEYYMVITDKPTGKAVFTLSANGKAQITLPKGSYIIYVKSKNFVSASEEIMIDNPTSIFTKEIKLFPIQVGEQIKLKNVRFKQGTPELLEESYPILDHLVKVLKENPTMEIELGGHTDNVGSQKLNLALSEERVLKIKNYLISKGIHQDRVQGKGYGGLQPIAPNDVEENRRLNRRVEFKIIKI